MPVAKTKDQGNQEPEASQSGIDAEILAELKALRARVEELESSKSVAVANPSSENKTPYERNLEKLNAKLAQQKHAAEQAAALLEEGEFKFTISIDKEPMMTRIVGATTENEHEAIRKYNTYFGIRSSNKEIRAVRVEGAEKAVAK